jgi:hypothetical protein
MSGKRKPQPVAGISVILTMLNKFVTKNLSLLYSTMIIFNANELKMTNLWLNCREIMDNSPIHNTIKGNNSKRDYIFYRKETINSFRSRTTQSYPSVKYDVVLVSKHHAMKAYRGHGHKAPSILKPDTLWMKVVVLGSGHPSAEEAFSCMH